MTVKTEKDVPRTGKRQGYNRLLSQLMIERSSFDSQWKTISDYVAPTRSRFLVNDANKGHRRNDKINDNTATIAGRVLESGMQSGMTNPATRWFKIQPKNKALRENWDVMDWCEKVEDILYGIILGSGFYNSFAQMYGDEGHYGTSPVLIEEDFETVIRTRVLPVGSYYIAQDARGKVNVFFRVFQMTVRQIVDEIGRGGVLGAEIDWSHISSHVKELWCNGTGSETWVEVHHVICPNQDYDKNKLGAKHKKYASCLYESGRSMSGGYLNDQDGDDLFLRESGYDYFPVLVARWGLTGEDVYATNCPGMLALGDVKQLQLGERRIMQAIDKQVNPPMNAPASAKSVRLTTLPGEINYVQASQLQEKFEPVYQVKPEVQALEFKQDQVRRRINEAYYKTTFVMFSDQPDKQPITAAEVAVRQSEKMLQLGPVLERHSTDVYDPAIEITFAMAERQGLIPTPPVDLDGDLEVEYVSVLAQAQKAAGIGAVDRFLDFLTRLSVLIKNAQGTEVFDKVDLDDLINDYAERTGVPRKIIVSDERVQELRAQRAKAQQQAQAVEAAPQIAGAVKDLSDSSLEGDSALSRIVQGAQRNSLAGVN